MPPGTTSLRPPPISKNETKSSLKKDLKAVHQYIADKEREYKAAVAALEAELLAEKAKVLALGKFGDLFLLEGNQSPRLAFKNNSFKSGSMAINFCGFQKDFRQKFIGVDI